VATVTEALHLWKADEHFQLSAVVVKQSLNTTFYKLGCTTVLHSVCKRFENTVCTSSIMHKCCKDFFPQPVAYMFTGGCWHGQMKAIQREPKDVSHSGLARSTLKR